MVKVKVYYPIDLNRKYDVTIEFTDVEKRIINFLKEFLTKFVDEDGVEEIEVRIVGGWVRDKLKGDNSKDIDLMVYQNNPPISGKKFSELLAIYYHDVYNQELKIQDIEQKEEQSKHLEVATFTLFGESIDVVAPREEVYYEEFGRIPEIRTTTPIKDAERRDLTINSLFYNISTDAVEDFTGQGFDDLFVNEIIRTPLNPTKTFLDDPLRLIRAFRFSAKYNFAIDPSIIDSANDDNIIDSLNNKVARERITEEFKKLISYPGFGNALINIIKNRKLLNVLVDLPTGYDTIKYNKYLDDMHILLSDKNCKYLNIQPFTYKMFGVLIMLFYGVYRDCDIHVYKDKLNERLTDWVQNVDKEIFRYQNFIKDNPKITNTISRLKRKKDEYKRKLRLINKRFKEKINCLEYRLQNCLPGTTVDNMVIDFYKFLEGDIILVNIYNIYVKYQMDAYFIHVFMDILGRIVPLDDILRNKGGGLMTLLANYKFIENGFLNEKFIMLLNKTYVIYKTGSNRITRLCTIKSTREKGVDVFEIIDDERDVDNLNPIKEDSKYASDIVHKIKNCVIAKLLNNEVYEFGIENAKFIIL